MFKSETEILRKYHHEFYYEEFDKKFLEYLREEVEGAFSESASSR